MELRPVTWQRAGGGCWRPRTYRQASAPPAAAADASPPPLALQTKGSKCLFLLDVQCSRAPAPVPEPTIDLGLAPPLLLRRHLRAASALPAAVVG